MPTLQTRAGSLTGCLIENGKRGWARIKRLLSKKELLAHIPKGLLADLAHSSVGAEGRHGATLTIKGTGMSATYKSILGFLLGLSILTGMAAVSQNQGVPNGKDKYPIVKPIAPRFDAAKALKLSQEQRWQLDFELVNEADMREINSRRFNVPNAYEKRALWYEEIAQGYELADLINQLINFRTSSVTHNEAAFTRLFEIGKTGDVGAACMAERFYRRFVPEITAEWKLQYDEVALVAAQYIDSQHPVCSELEWYLYARGKGGFVQDLPRAKRAYIKPAIAGFYEWQHTMQLSHLKKVLQFSPQHVEASMCWMRLADQHSAHAGLRTHCDSYKLGVDSDGIGNLTQVPESIQTIAHQWCEPTRVVATQDCVNLETQLNSFGD